MDGGANIDTNEIPELVSGLKKFFRTGRTRPLEWRRRQLRGIETLMHEKESVFLDALAADVGKPRFEGWISETGFVASDARHTAKHLAKWMKPEKVMTGVTNLPGSSRILREPLGTVLIIGPFNYPLQLMLSPLIGAIAAGNAAVLKPSEMTPHTSAAIAEWLPRYVDADAVKMVLGGIPETTALLRERFDHIFYTGSTAVGRIVMRAAAEHLTPVTLELGGKSPCIIDRDVDIEVAARRIAWGKFFNAGQTCVAPDYLLVHEAIEDAFLHRLTAKIQDFYGDDPEKSPDLARIVNDRHHARLSGLLGEGEIVCGGETNPETRYIAPTVIRGVTRDMKIMQEEIFGPILPVLTVRGVDEAIDFVNEGEKPLALYVYTNDSAKSERVLAQTSSGGAAVNECVAHMVGPELPFGGVGQSGMGAYHGRASFETFSHQKSVLVKSTKLEPPLRYPPYTDGKEKLARKIL